MQPVLTIQTKKNMFADMPYQQTDFFKYRLWTPKDKYPARERDSLPAEREWNLSRRVKYEQIIPSL